MRFFGSCRTRVMVIAVFAVLAIPCFAGEVAVLKNGFSIRHERREVFGDITRLYVNADGSSYVDVPTSEIEHFEAAPELPSTAPTFTRNSIAMSQAFERNGQNAPVANLEDVINTASGRYRLDPDLVASVIKAESGFNVRAVSPKGAQGLMQLMPGTASLLGVPNTFDAQANVEGGTRYLRELLERYNFDLVKALAAYNAGPERVEHFGGVPPFYETRAYVARVVRDFNRKKAAQKNAGTSKSAATTPSTNHKTNSSVAKPHNSNSVTQASANAQ
jgi:hypothetical protein